MKILKPRQGTSDTRFGSNFRELKFMQRRELEEIHLLERKKRRSCSSQPNLRTDQKKNENKYLQKQSEEIPKSRTRTNHEAGQETAGSRTRNRAPLKPQFTHLEGSVMGGRRCLPRDSADQIARAAGEGWSEEGGTGRGRKGMDDDG
jgi:hypothetical protein